MAAALRYAVEQVGDPYGWGAEGPDAFDCSGLLFAALTAGGYKVKRTTAAEIGRGRGGYGTASRSTDLSRAQAGAILYYDNPGATDHVALYLGNGQMVEAPTEGVPVRVTKARQPTQIRYMPQQMPGGDDTTTSGWEELGDAAAGAASALNPFGLWQDDVLRIGLIVLGGFAAATLVIVGAKEAVKESNA